MLLETVGKNLPKTSCHLMLLHLMTSTTKTTAIETLHPKFSGLIMARNAQ